MNNHFPDDYSRLYEQHSPSSQKNSVPQPEKPAQPFSPVPLLLIAGIIFLFLGGIIFLTNTWKILPDFVRALALLSASVIAFGTHSLAERIFHLKKTALTFFILGCIFLPLAFCGIGIFHLFGTWLSFTGNGKALLWLLIFFSLSASTFFGYRKYHYSGFSFISLFGMFGVWVAFCSFITDQFRFSTETKENISSVIRMLYAVGICILSEFFRKKFPESLQKTISIYLYSVNLLSAGFAFFHVNSTFIAAVCFFILAILFGNNYFIHQNFHIGIFGSAFCLSQCLFQCVSLFDSANRFTTGNYFTFAVLISSVLFMNLQKISYFREELRKTYSHAGMLFSFLLIIPESFQIIENHHSFFLLGVLFFIGGIFFFKNHSEIISSETKIFLLHVSMFFLFALDENALIRAGLLISSLILIPQFFSQEILWKLVLPLLTCGAVLIANFSYLRILWITTSALLMITIYANRKWRFHLERCAAWAFLACLSITVYETAHCKTEHFTAFFISLCVIIICYLLELFVFWKDLRPNFTKPYIEMEILFLSLIACFWFNVSSDYSEISAFLFYLMLIIFSGVFLRKNHNFAAIPELVMSFNVVNSLIDYSESVVMNVFIYLFLLFVYVIMGRICLPEFFHREENIFQIDWALLAGVLPVFGAVSTIHWYHSILLCLFLAVYSWFYTGRMKNSFIPLIMCSAFSCLTLLFHNIHDPFHIFEFLYNSEMKTPVVLLSLLPIHLFILSLLWILPERFRSAIHKARFIMYCFTMLCLLCVSFNFKIVSDALLLMLFSFGILLGSFNVKKLRWFALGFSVLFLTTVRLTRKFWTSLHWGIYLLLAGIILIGVASFTEYKNRYAAEHPDEPKKKFNPFQTWTW